MRDSPTSRIADIILPRQKLVLELTLESAQALANFTQHKQGHLRDFYLAGFRVVVINPW